MDLMWVAAVAFFIFTKLIGFLLLGYISINIVYFRENKEEIAELEVKGRGFSYRYKTSPGLWFSLNKGAATGKKKSSTGKAREQNQETSPEPGMEKLNNLKTFLPLILRVVKWFFRKAEWKNAEVRLNYGSGDAASTAMVIGLARTLGENLRAGLKRKSAGDGKKRKKTTFPGPVLEFEPDYNRQKLEAYLNLQVQVRLYLVIFMVIYLYYQLKAKRRPDHKNG